MIEVEHVSKKFGNFSAVDDISFSIKTGEIIGLLGPNGAGKTTTMRMITGYLESTSGVIKIDGIDVEKDPVAAKRKIGYMPESAPLYGDMIVADYLKYLADIEGVDSAIKLPDLCNLCGLKEVMHKNINELSRGNKQRVGLAHALMNDPEILILDEPTSGLDPNQVVQVRELIKEIGKTRTVIISTHILSEVEALADRVIIISGGKKVADSSTAELEQNYGAQKSVLMCLAGGDEDKVKEKLSKIDGVLKVSIEKIDSKFMTTVYISEDKEIRPLLVKTVVDSGWELYLLEENKNSLEDVFRTLTNGGAQK